MARPWRPEPEVLHALHNIFGVARYERMLLLRTTRFRILGSVGVVLPLLIGIGLAVLEARGIEFSSALGMGAFIPFYVYSYLQAVVIAFIVGDFRAADERAEIYEVIAGRPISTAELVIGKYLGVVGAMSTLSIAVLLLTVAIQAAKLSLLDSPFTIKPYLIYLFVMTLPALIYMSALTFFLGAVFRQQTAVALLTIAYALAVLFYLGEGYGGIWDFGAFFAPLFYSDMVGLGDLTRVIDQRLFYLALGLFFFGLSIERYPRLSQSLAWAWVGRSMALAGLVAAVGLYQYMQAQDEGDVAYRQRLLAEQYRFAELLAPQVEHYGFDIALAGEQAPLVAQVQMRLYNYHDAALDSLIFTLNPGLALQSVQDSLGNALAWTRGETVICVQAPMAAGAERVLTLVYDGTIERQGFDLLRDETRLQKSKWPFIKGDLTAWIRDESVFLPPRSRWYPIAGVAYHPQEPAPPSFATADISVSVPKGLEVVAQGEPTGKQQRDDRSISTWKVEYPVPQFSLNAGQYEVYETTVGEVDYALYVHASHLRPIRFFLDAPEKVTETIDQVFGAMEQETGLSYPYGRLSIVEVPFLVQWYYEGWEESGGLVQPGVLMVEEDVLMGHRFQRDFDARLQRQRGNEDKAQIKKDVLVGAIFQDFLSPEGGRSGLFRSPLVQLWSFDRGFSGENADLVARGLPLYMHEDVSSDLRVAMFSSRFGGRLSGGMARMISSMMRSRGGMGRRGPGGGMAQPVADTGPAWDTLVVEMQQNSLAEMDKQTEPELYRAILKAKSLTIFRVIKSVLGADKFIKALGVFNEDNKYGQVSFADFEDSVIPDGEIGRQKIDVQQLVHDWIYGTHVPGYTLTRATAKKMDDGWGEVVYQVIVRIKNGEPGPGFVEVQAIGREDQGSKSVMIEGGQEVEVSMVLFARPFRVMVEPFFAKNQRPIVAALSIPEKVFQGYPKSYVRVVDDAENFFSEIVVDNDDEGFSMPIRRVRRFLRPGLKGDNWQVQQLPFAFGRYETNFRWKQPGDGAQPAVWATELPVSGDYDVAYYFVPSQFGRRFGLNLAESFSLSVTHGGVTDTLAMKAETLNGGWNLLGRFHFEEGEEARVELSDQASGRLYADAMRWRWVDPDNPEAAYEEDVGSFGNWRGRGGRGGRSGRGWRGGARSQASGITSWLNRLF